MGFSESRWGGVGGALGFSGGILVAAVVPPDLLVCSWAQAPTSPSVGSSEARNFLCKVRLKPVHQPLPKSPEIAGDALTDRNYASIVEI